MNAKSFHLTAQGASHIKKNKECQDASSSYQDEKCAIAIVCDGHGGDDYVRSAIGSKIGCAVAEKNIKNFVFNIDKETFFKSPEKHIKNLEASIINGWNESIATYHSTRPFQDSELTVVSEKARKKYVEDGRIESAYGTTMIAVAMTHEYWFGIHIGDGKCVAINPEGEFKQPIPWDPKCFLNATTSICDSDAIERFRHFYSAKLPAAVFVGSDGIDDCFSNNEQLHNLYKTVLYSFATTDFEEACAGLEDYLPRLSAKGSGDDVSIAALLDLDLIPELSIVKDFDREKEKARIEENARKEAEKNEAEKRRVEEEHARFQQKNNSKTKHRWSAPKFCENCGAPIAPGVKFCCNCGSRIKYYDTQKKTPIEQQDVQEIKITSFSSAPDHEITDSVRDIEEVENEKTSALVGSDITSDNDGSEEVDKISFESRQDQDENKKSSNESTDQKADDSANEKVSNAVDKDGSVESGTLTDVFEVEQGNEKEDSVGEVESTDDVPSGAQVMDIQETVKTEGEVENEKR